LIYLTRDEARTATRPYVDSSAVEVMNSPYQAIDNETVDEEIKIRTEDPDLVGVANRDAVY
jgi:hypothetical protein